MRAMWGKSQTRDFIAMFVVVLWLGVPSLAALAAVFGRVDFRLLTEDLLPIWHEYYSWVATLVLGFYFGAVTSGSSS